MGLELVELVMAVEKGFDASFGSADASDLTSVGSLFDFAMRHLEPDRIADAHGPYYGERWEQYLDILEETLPVSRDRLRPGARFGIDIILL